MTNRTCCIALAALLVLTTASAKATETFCVDSIAEFNAAYLEEDDVVIQLVRGTYDMTQSCIDALSFCDRDGYDLTLRGGYAPGCGSRTLSAVDTVLTRPGGGLFIATYGGAFGDAGDVVLESLTVRNVPEKLKVRTEASTTEDAFASLRRVWFDQTGGLQVDMTSEVFLRQSLISRTTSACAVYIPAPTHGVYGYLENATFSQVTIADSSANGLCIGEGQTSDWSVTIENSIFWGNAGDDILFDVEGNEPLDARLQNNTYSSLVSTSVLSEAPSGTLNSDPQFVNPAAGDFELGGTSSSINSAFPLPNALNDFDMKGDPRVFSYAADRGALESPVGSTATTLVVTSTADSGFGTLRQAILDANQSPNFNRITFDIGSTCGPHVINLASNLPAVLYPVEIDGYTQPGANRNTQISGSNGQICIILQQGASSSAFVGLQLATQAGGETQLHVEGLGFSNFLVAGISLNAGNGHTILGNQFGGTLGTVNLGPSGYGVNVTYEAIGVQIGGPEPSDRNVFNDASEAAIKLSGSFGEFATQALVQNNYIGLAADGDTPRPNDKGLVVYGDHHRITGNVISSNDDVGIDIIGEHATNTLVDSNVFGRPAVLCFPGACDRGNGSHGVRIRDGAMSNIVSGNTFAYNGGDGVAIVSAHANPVTANSFYDNDGEGIDLGDDSITPNDNDAATPSASAGNLGQNYPMITSASGLEASGYASGSLESVNGWFLIELYASNDCGSFFNLTEGRDRVGRQFVEITNAPPGQNGSATFSNAELQKIDDPTYFSQPRWIVATATRYSSAPSSGGRPRETSEFGVCIPYVVLDDLIFEDDFDGP